MKSARHEKIVELIQKYDIDTQEELAARLLAAGFKVTQATVSRDIRALNMTKIAGRNGKMRYTILEGKGGADSGNKYSRVLNEAVLSAEAAQNLVVIHTAPGMAMAVAAALDAFRDHLSDPAILVNHEKKPADRLKVFHVIVREDRKISALVRILRKENCQAVVFTRKRSTAAFVSEKLNGSGFRSAAVRSDSDYRQRRETMKLFRAGSLDVLCTTDLFSRGMDVPLDVVIFYDPADNESILIHRTGRTARFSASGRVIHILTPGQKHVLKAIEKTASVRSCPYESQ